MAKVNEALYAIKRTHDLSGFKKIHVIHGFQLKNEPTYVRRARI